MCSRSSAVASIAFVKETWREGFERRRYFFRWIRSERVVVTRLSHRVAEAPEAENGEWDGILFRRHDTDTSAERGFPTVSSRRSIFCHFALKVSSQLLTPPPPQKGSQDDEGLSSSSSTQYRRYERSWEDEALRVKKNTYESEIHFEFRCFPWPNSCLLALKAVKRQCLSLKRKGSREVSSS